MIDKKLNVLGIIPARGGSKRIPRKNLCVLGDKPLVCLALETALSSSGLDRVIVSSDDEEILSLVRNYGPKYALKRPDTMAGDEALAVEYVRHAMDELERSENVRYDVFVIIQPSSPFTEDQDINRALDNFFQSNADSVVSVVELDHFTHPTKLKTMDDNDQLHPYFEEEKGRMAFHELEKVYVRNGSIYISSRAVIESGQVIGNDCRGYTMPRERSLDINGYNDLAFARFIMQEKANGKYHVK